MPTSNPCSSSGSVSSIDPSKTTISHQSACDKLASNSDQFVRCAYVVVRPGEKIPDAPIRVVNPLDKFSLRGKSDEIEKNAVDAVPILGQLALQGQATVFYAAPNTGKTLISLSLLVDAIQHCRVNPSKVYYLNMDDTNSGVVEKLRIAEEYGFHVLAEGHQGFSANQFLGHIAEMIRNNQAHGVVIILDTLKKFVNLMDKGNSSNFTKVIRQFVMNGGTLIALAHTNKKPGQDGKPVYGGTSDIIDDFDCAYTLAPITPKAGHGEKVVEFENLKRRGNVVPSAAYSYSIENGIPYAEILLSVQPIDVMQLVPLKQAEQLKSDAELVNSVITCIGDGINTKMKLADAVAKSAGVSKRSAMQIIDKYTGADPAKHMWTYSVHARGAKVYALLVRMPPNQGQDTNDT
ncbi:MAG: AAA family ATPase [Thiobacillus sp.]|nr:AAA family ATPase [Thiobacillus sp.]